MNKYIDADKLITEIHKHIGKYDSMLNEWSIQEVKGKREEAFSILTIIESLQQEPLQKSKKNCDGCPHCVERKDQYGWHFKGCFGGPYKGKFIAEIDECPLKQEQPEMDLERDAVQFCFDKGLNVTPYQAKTIARHFYELGLNARK